MDTFEHRIHIRFDSERPDDSPFVNELFVLCNDQIPTEKHRMVQFFHSVMVSLENFMLGEGDDDLSRESIKKLADMFKQYAIENRNKLSKANKQVLWMIQTRMDWLIYLINGEVDCEKMDNQYLLDNNMLVSKQHPFQYSIDVLWRAIKVVIERLNTLRYNKVLEDYIHVLYLRCAHLTWISSPEKVLFNNVVYARKLSSTEFCINDTFLIETERIFRDIWKRFYRWRDLGPVIKMNDFPVANKVAFGKWASDISRGLFRSNMEREFRESIYDDYVFVSEMERYLEETPDFGSPNSFAIIARYRQKQIDDLSKLLAEPNFIENILDGRERTKKDVHKVDINYDSLCRTFVRYFFDSHVGSRENMDDYFYSGRSTVSNETIIQSSFKFPLLVQLFREYGVIYKGSTVTYSDLGQCFMAWTKTVCEEEEISGRFPNSSASVIPLYDVFFPEGSDSIKRENDDLGLELSLPEEYSKLVVSESASFF